MHNIPLYIPLVFSATVAATVFLFYQAANRSKTVLFVLMAWIGFQAMVGGSGIYDVPSSAPPRFPLLVVPPLILTVILFFTKKGQRFIDGLDLKTLTILHTIRIPIEIVLFWLFLQKAIPILMTFEGRNFDILSGLTAPIIYYFAFYKQKTNKNALIFWNIASFILLANIVLTALFSAPSPFQKFAFDQPNIAVLHFPYNWLPSVVVPIVLFSHLASIRQLLGTKH